MRPLSMLTFIACMLGLAAPTGTMAQDGDKDKKISATIGLHLLEEKAGASIGAWNIWRYDEGDKAIFMIHRKTGFALYLPWSSNGWVNYRTPDGIWNLMLSKRQPQRQNRADLMIAPYLTKTPTHRAATGKFKFEGSSVLNGVTSTFTWVVNISKDHLDFHNETTDDRITVRANASEFTHNGRTMAYHAFDGTVEKDDPKVKISVPSGQTVELPAKVFDVKLFAGRKYVFDLTSKAIDPVLVLQNQNGGQIAFDDDGGEGLNSRLNYTPAADGTVKVFAATLNGAGKFDLRIKDDSALTVYQVDKGLTLNGKLDAATKQIVYHVMMFKDKSYVVDMSSQDFDSYLVIQNGAGKELARDDDGGGNLDARVPLNVTGTGIFQIVATSFQGKGAGAFTLTVREK